MTAPDTRRERRALADRLQAQGHLTSPVWRAAVEAVPREAFLGASGVFLPEDNAACWRPVAPGSVETKEWVEIAYGDESLVTQLDGHLTPDQATGPVTGFPTSSSTVPATVVGMLEDLDVDDGMTVLEIGTGTGYSTALLCHRLGEDQVTSIEVDPEVAKRADDALEACGYSTWTVTGDGLLGHPRRAPYDRIIATCAVRRIPHAWIRQTSPGGIILATVGSWSRGTGLAKVTVTGERTAEGRIIGRSSFMPARAQAPVPLSGDLAARTAYADTTRPARIAPGLLHAWMPAFLAQLAAPGVQMINTASGGEQRVYLFDTDRESFAELARDGDAWTVRQGGPVALWDAIETAVTTWQGTGEPDISAVQLDVTPAGHTYWIGDDPTLRWEHRLV